MPMMSKFLLAKIQDIDWSVQFPHASLKLSFNLVKHQLVGGGEAYFIRYRKFNKYSSAHTKLLVSEV